MPAPISILTVAKFTRSDDGPQRFSNQAALGGALNRRRSGSRGEGVRFARLRPPTRAASTIAVVTMARSSSEITYGGIA